MMYEPSDGYNTDAFGDTVTIPQHQATQEAEAEKRIGADREAVGVVIGKVTEIDTTLKQIKIVTHTGLPQWAFYGHMLTQSQADALVNNKRSVRLTVPIGKGGSRQAFFSGEIVDPSSE